MPTQPVLSKNARHPDIAFAGTPTCSNSFSNAAVPYRSSLVDYLARKVLIPPDCVERVHAAFLDWTSAQIGESPLGTGNACVVSLRLRDLFAHALAVGARGIVLAHNHPSGECHPSASDDDATRMIAGVARSLEIELVDHLIFTQDAVFSMRRGTRV